MAYIKGYWKEKDNMMKKAKKHTKEMESKFKKEIVASVQATKIYDSDSFSLDIPNKSKETFFDILVDDIDSVGAITKYNNGKTAVLNFASYKNPGGMFLKGSKAQEECLCHESFLYNILKGFQKDYYNWNKEHLNKALYTNRALFSENVMFFRDNKQLKCDVITCAAPNKATAQKYYHVSDDENFKILRERIKFVLDIAKDNDVDTLILGAFGCGVFGQDANEVASIFKELIAEMYGCFKVVVFAIPNGRIGNFEKFKRIFSDCEETSYLYKAGVADSINSLKNESIKDCIPEEKVNW